MKKEERRKKSEGWRTKHKELRSKEDGGRMKEKEKGRMKKEE